MNRKNPEMTSKLASILEDPAYHDPRQFTDTLYNDRGQLIDTAFEYEQWMNWRSSLHGRPEEDYQPVRNDFHSVFEEERKLAGEDGHLFTPSSSTWTPSRLQSVMQGEDLERAGDVVHLPDTEEEGE